MSHFTTLVIIEKGMSYEPEQIPIELERRLAPFMENCCAEPDKMYMKFYDEEDEYRRQYEEEGREMVVMPDGRLLLPWDGEFKIPWKKGDDPLARFSSPKAPENLPKKTVPFKETYSTFEKFVKDWHGREARDETYNRYGYWQNGPKYLIDLCLGNEEQILQGLREMETKKVLLSGDKTTGRWDYNLPILPMQTMRPKGSEEESISGGTQKVVLEREIWDFLGRISATPGATKRIMSDLFSTIKGQANSSGSQPQNRSGESYIVRALQYTLGDGSRQYRCVACGNKVPHEAHVTGSTFAGGAKWDWFEVGGRWSGFFKLKPGHTGGLGKQYNFGGIKESKDRADIAFKKAIDFEFMRNEREKTAAERYDLVWEAIKGTPESDSWEEVRSEFDLKKEGEIDKARAKYYAQPRVQAFKELSMSKKGMELFDFYSGIEDYQVPRDQYLANARNHAGVPFALIKDGTWYEHGEMGWWGNVSNEKDPETWNAMVNKMMDELQDDTLLIAIDCHI